MEDLAACTACAALPGRIGDAVARDEVGFAGVGESLARQART
jgi:hypothetical protein